MVLAMRSKKSLSDSKPFGRKKSGVLDSNGSDSYKRKFAKRDGDGDVREFGRKPSYRKPGGFGRDGYDGETRSRGGDHKVRGHRERGDGNTLFTERKFGRRGGDGDRKEFGRRPSYRKERGYDREDRDGEMRDRGGNRDMKGGKEFGRRPSYRKERGYDRGGRDEGASSRGGDREIRGQRGGKGDQKGVRIPFRSEVVDQLKSRGRNMARKRRDADGVGIRELRGDRRKKRLESHFDGSKEIDESVDAIEASSDKLRLKWKKMDKKWKDTDVDSSVAERSGHRGKEDDNRRGKETKMDTGEGKEELVEHGSKSEASGDQAAEKKPVRHVTRVLDKSGKKVRVAQKHSDDDSAGKGVPVKKKKRIIKIDPYDISNKRLDDSLPAAGNEDTNEDKDSEISKNAQFRAIQPSPAILSFVEDNLLGRRRLNELKDAGYNVKLSAPLDNVPFSTSTERERIEENVFRNKLEFFAAAKISSSFPPPEIPEIAFAGRSNVGKSSLLNALTRQWGVVRTSDKPGLTQTINFFKLSSNLSLVDLPGYGFAYAKEEVKDAWEELVKEYVSTRVGLQRVCLLIDTKWGMKPRDHELIDLMERSRTPYQIVLTKTDLVFPIDVARRAMQIQESLKKNKSIVKPVMMASSKSGAGIPNLRSVLAKITRFVKP